METTVMPLVVPDLVRPMKMLPSHSSAMNAIQPLSKLKTFKTISQSQNMILLLMESVWFVEKFYEVTYDSIFGDLT